MNKRFLRIDQLALLSFLTLMLPGCGYNRLQGLDEEVKASWSEVQNQYQRRADLVPEGRIHRSGPGVPGLNLRKTRHENRSRSRFR